MMDTINYFGYGSLVNLDTLRTPYLSAHPATLKGWKRVWLSRPAVEGSFAPFDGLAFLSVKPSAETIIEGMLVEDHASSLSALDEREALYDRRKISVADIVLKKGSNHRLDDQTSFLYVAQKQVFGDGKPPQILRSYLDAVFQGYLTYFGEDSLARFVETTDNFQLPIFEDREAPIYPRTVETTQIERELFDTTVPPGGFV